MKNQAKLPKLITAVMILMLCGCSLTRTIDPVQFDEIRYDNANRNTLAIDARDLLTSNVTAVGSTHNVTVQNGENLINLIKNESKKYFNDVIILNTDEPASYDVLLYAKTETKSIMGVGGGGSFLFTTKVPYRATFVNNKEKIVFGDVFDDYVLYRPDGIMPLGILTGLSMMTLAPITMPVMAGIAADAITEEVSKADIRISQSLVEKLIMQNLHVKSAN